MNYEFSRCCNSGVEIANKHRDSTHFYVCKACCKACDVVTISVQQDAVRIAAAQSTTVQSQQPQLQ